MIAAAACWAAAVTAGALLGYRVRRARVGAYRLGVAYGVLWMMAKADGPVTVGTPAAILHGAQQAAVLRGKPITTAPHNCPGAGCLRVLGVLPWPAVARRGYRR
jgi:hypothetical protein